MKPITKYTKWLDTFRAGDVDWGTISPENIIV